MPTGPGKGEVAAPMDTELQSLADALASRLDRPVTIEDWQLRMLAYSSHSDEHIDTARHRSIIERQTPVDAVAWVRSHVETSACWCRVPVAPEVGLELERVCLPLRRDGSLIGYLWLLEGRVPLSEEELAVARDAAERITIVLRRELLIEVTVRRRERELLSELLTADSPAARVHAAASLVDHDYFVADEPVAVIAAMPKTPADVLDEPTRASLEETLTEVGRLAGARRHAVVARHDHVVLLLVDDAAGSGPNGVDGLAEVAASRLARSCPPVAGCIGVGMSQGALADAATSWRQAVQAAHVAQRVPGVGPVARFDRLGVYAVLARLPKDELGSELIHPGVLRLIDLGRQGAAYLTAVECYLDHAGDARAAADALSLHRTTLYYRLQKAEEHAGASLSSGRDRLAMHLGIKLARLAGLFADDASVAS